jgi:hypothetical protein
VIVGNTGGIEVYLRHTPKLGDKRFGLPEGTKLAVLGDQTDAVGRRWLQVRDPAGRVGWVPARYTVPRARRTSIREFASPVVRGREKYGGGNLTPKQPIR